MGTRHSNIYGERIFPPEVGSFLSPRPQNDNGQEKLEDVLLFVLQKEEAREITAQAVKGSQSNYIMDALD